MMPIFIALGELLTYYDFQPWPTSDSDTRAKSVSCLRKKWGLQSTRQQKHTSETIADAAAHIRKEFPTQGNEGVRKDLRMRFGMHVPRYDFFTTC